LFWALPLNQEWDRLWGAFLARKIELSGFLNYANLWDKGQLLDPILSEGIELSLQLENKGVAFHLGMGVGQVYGDPFELYATLGFRGSF
jgi:hypothetical protein